MGAVLRAGVILGEEGVAQHPICKGAHFRAEFLQMAQEKGAIAYVSQRPYPSLALPCLQVSDMRLTIAPLEKTGGSKIGT